MSPVLERKHRWAGVVGLAGAGRTLVSLSEVHRFGHHPALFSLVSSRNPFRSNGSSSRETPSEQSYVRGGEGEKKNPKTKQPQKKRATRQLLFPATTFLWTPSPPLTSSPADTRKKQPNKRTGREEKNNDTSFPSTTKGGGGVGGCGWKRLRWTCTLPWSEKTLHRAARFFFFRLTLAGGGRGGANVS